MIVSLISKKCLASISLPQKVRGQYTIASKKISVNVEGINEKWHIKSSKHVKIVDNENQVINDCEIEEMGIYYLKVADSDEKMFIFVEPSTDDRIEFQKYIVGINQVFTIGRKKTNSIVINNSYVSAIHAELFYNNGIWQIRDVNSSNGTFVNGQVVESKILSYGDVIYIMGTMIIVGNRLLAINNPDGKVYINSDNLIKFVPQRIETTEEEVEVGTQDYFYRSPRFKRDIETAQFKIDAPPADQNGDEMPIMLAIGPSMTMGMASVATGIFGVLNGNLMSAVTSTCMLCGTILWPIISKRYEKRRKEKKEQIRQTKYREYLVKMRAAFAEEGAKQRDILFENTISIEECKERVTKISRNLWDRSLGQNDFLKIRIGIGNLKLDADIKYPERTFTIKDDLLKEELYTLCETPQMLHDVPLSVSLFDNNITGVIGNQSDILPFANGIILQLATFYSYDEVKFVFIFDKNRQGELEYTKWLPHVWNNDNTFRFYADCIDDVRDISSYLENEFEARKVLREEALEEVKPYYVIFSFSKQLSLRADILPYICESKKNLHFSVVTFSDELRNLPKECTNVIELDGRQGKLYNKNDISGEVITFRPDINIRAGMDELSVMLANIQLDLEDTAFQLPKMITFLEMIGVGKIEHLNVLSRWKENDPTKTLEAQIGVDTIGDPFKLDLHEKYHGPHGLVAGMTGSGKSEFIMTYILSLAINYHPYEVAFILIDYKGGGMAKAFENLPHTAGIITNLDGSAVNRSLISIQSELKRRQAIFAQASKQSGISNIDIYKYQKMYREGKVTEPLQHLFIISDEFAELKTQQPEFMTQLVSAARIGRSLGVHLILATQKPSGVVDDQIWSNSKFRACLKVQDKSDSMDMLKRPEAAELQETGRFYLQVGYNEMFKLGQSAWAGAPYYPSERVEVNLDDSIEIIDNVGKVIQSAKMNRRNTLNINPQKQIDAITEYLAEIAKQEKIEIRQLWLDPIPDMIYVDQLIEKYQYRKDDYYINPVIGEYDDPMNQRQEILTLPLTTEGNTVVYGMAGSGKTTFLTTMMYSMLRTYTPEEVNIYILDFAAETLTAFSKAPHVGDVVLSYEEEKVHNLFKLLMGQIATRKKLFANYGGDIVSYHRNTEEKVPSIVVAINNYAAFSEMYEDLESVLLNLTREGTKYGIYFVLTAIGTGAIRFRMVQNFKQIFVLQLADEGDYSSVVGKTDGLLPAKIKGRGLFRVENVFEFQTAHPFETDNQFMRIREYCSKLREIYQGKARGIPVLPDMVDREFIEDYITPNSLVIPVGVETASLEISYVDFDKTYISIIHSKTNNYIEFVSLLANVIANKAKIDTTLLDPKGEIPDMTAVHYAKSAKENIVCVEELFELVLTRHNAIKDAEEQDVDIPVFDKQVFIITALSELKTFLNDEQSEKLNLALERGSLRLNISIIIAEVSKNLSSVNFEKWYKNNVSQEDGIWIGEGISDQYFLKVNKTTTEMNKEISDQFGFVVSNGKATQVKILSEIKEE